MKKLVSLILAIMMIAMVGAAFAAGNTDGQLTDGKDGMLYDDDNEGAKDGNTITITKQLVVYNTNGEEIYLPNVVYSYTVTAPTVAANSTVTDGDNDTGVVYAGVMDALTSTYTSGASTVKGAQVTYATTDAKVIAAAKGTAIDKTFTLTFDPSKFPHAGIYRYLITETYDDLAAAGVYRDTTHYSGATRYLDVYVRRAVTTDNVSTNYVIYGYVLMNETSSPASVTENTTTTKTNGWMATINSTSGECTDADIYNTYNLKVTKTITGSLADTAHQFPFSVALTLPTRLTKTVRVYTEGSSHVTGDDTSFTVSHTFGDLTSSSHILLANNEYVLIVGIPAETTAVVTEINNTWDIYKASQTSITNGTDTAPAAINLAAQSATGSQYQITAVDNNTNDYNTNAITAGDVEIIVNNNMEIISPTGYVSRFAPYALILVAGIALLIVAKKRKPAKDDEE